MEELLEFMERRRSVRNYTEERIPDEKLELVLKAGLLAPSGRGIRPWELIVVRDQQTLAKLAESRVSGAQMLKQADCAVVVIADGKKTDVWTEDCCNVMMQMHLMAGQLGVGSCWIQGRLREAPDGRTTEEYVRELLGFPEQFHLEAMLSLGIPAEHPVPRKIEKEWLLKIHKEKF